MDYFKKAQDQVTAAVKKAQDVSQQLQTKYEQHKQSQPAYGQFHGSQQQHAPYPQQYQYAQYGQGMVGVVQPQYQPSQQQQVHRLPPAYQPQQHQHYPLPNQQYGLDQHQSQPPQQQLYDPQSQSLYSPPDFHSTVPMLQPPFPSPPVIHTPAPSEHQPSYPPSVIHSTLPTPQQPFPSPPVVHSPPQSQQLPLYSPPVVHSPVPSQEQPSYPPTVVHSPAPSRQQPTQLEREAGAQQYPGRPLMAAELHANPSAPEAVELPATPSALQPQPRHVPRPIQEDPGRTCPGQKQVLADLMPTYVLKPELLPAGVPEVVICICSVCYSSQVSSYPHLAASFIVRAPEPQDPDKPQTSFRARIQIPQQPILPKASFDQLSCDFALPLVRQIFYRGCVSQGSVNPLIQYASFVISLPPCTGSLVEQSAEYYGSDHLPGMAMCTTCFENFVRGTSFEHELQKHAPTPNFMWYCDIGRKGYVFRLLLAELNEGRPDFRRFASRAKARIELPQCNGPGKTIQPTDASGRCLAYRAVGGKSGIICSECFYDHVLGTSMEQVFGDHFELEEKQKRECACDLGEQTSKFAMEQAVRANDDDVWRRAVGGRARLPACVGIAGVDEEQLVGQDLHWYQYTTHPEVEVCPFCYTTVVELLGAGSLFTPVTRTLIPGFVRMCFLAQPPNMEVYTADDDNFQNSLTWRGGILRSWLHYGHAPRGDFSVLEHAAAFIAAWPSPCGGNRHFKPASRRHFFGNVACDPQDENKVSIAICEECLELRVKGTSLEAFLNHDVTEDLYRRMPAGFSCNVGTKRTQFKLGEACKKGDWLLFSRFWTEREARRRRFMEVEVACQRQAVVQRNAAQLATAQAELQLRRKLNAMTNATIISGGASVVEAATTDYGQRWGNSNVGYDYLTSNGADAAQARLDAMNMPGVTTFGPNENVRRESDRLLALSKVVTAEWREYE